MEKLAVKKWAEEDRPREKLMLRGASALTDAELLAILIGSGSREETVVELAQRILHRADNNLNKLGQFSIKELVSSFKGIGEAKAITIAAAMELGKRRQQSEVLEVPQISSSRDAFHAFYPILSDLKHEEVWGLFLNRSNKIIKKFQLSKGGIHASVVDVRVLMKEAVESLACGLILGHNHPSGKLQASDEDRAVTQKVARAGEVLDIKLLDHIIVAGNRYLSFSDEGLMP
ncbi:MAG: DNA repair protein RadC [Dysgonamonadaceae bacterium]